MRKCGCKWGWRGPHDPTPRGGGGGCRGGPGCPLQGQAPPCASSHTGAGCFRFPPPRPGARPDPPRPKVGPQHSPLAPPKALPKRGPPQKPPAAQLGRAPLYTRGGAGPQIPPPCLSEQWGWGTPSSSPSWTPLSSLRSPNPAMGQGPCLHPAQGPPRTPPGSQPPPPQLSGMGAGFSGRCPEPRGTPTHPEWQNRDPPKCHHRSFASETAPRRAAASPRQSPGTAQGTKTL